MAKFLPASLRSMNPIQKYPHVVELLDCTPNLIVL